MPKRVREMWVTRWRFGRMVGKEGRLRATRGLIRSGAREVSARTIRPFFGYYGGKWRDAVRNYPPPYHGTIVEPFAGSAGYALRYWDKKVVLYERDPVVAAVWRY